LQEINYDPGLPGPLLDLLQKMLEKDPAQRMRIEQVKVHPWFRHPKDEVAPSTVVITQVP
jgi:serine/threonine protein kinase